jgi:hypothetical protein
VSDALLPLVRLQPFEGSIMKRFARETLTPLLALACAATVFLGAALESPDAARVIPAPPLTAR